MYCTNPFAPAAGPLYRQVRAEAGVHAATPHRLVAMLFEGLMESMAQARGALQTGQVQAKGAAITRAVAILEEGLSGGLDLSAGPLAHDLKRLYSYVATRLTLANLRSDDALLQECQNLVRPLQQAWAAISVQPLSTGLAAQAGVDSEKPNTHYHNPVLIHPKSSTITTLTTLTTSPRSASADAAPATESALSLSFAHP